MYCSIRTHLRAGSFSPLALLLALVAFGLALGGCGSSGASQDEIEAARKQGAAKAQQQANIRQIKKELQELKKGKSVPGAAQTATGTGTAPEGSSSSGSGNCGGSLSANSVTTCGFAANVQQAYLEELGSGSGTVYAYSPTIGQTYSMYCSSGSPHECTGGNDAAVYFP
jgi:hypothetical protein